MGLVDDYWDKVRPIEPVAPVSGYQKQIETLRRTKENDPEDFERLLEVYSAIDGLIGTSLSDESGNQYSIQGYQNIVDEEGVHAGIQVTLADEKGGQINIGAMELSNWLEAQR